ncbi:unnamed protein product [Hyaloperonospora brassicae]|uniref:RxLR effector candidate protein n=1 Tax=Hyaloperonospora brassicae TaxID=162125 RepID=A0AAV0US99_HYABA|nr:unnamed protein product [Hyaloperonospora brassicae]
MLAAVTLMALAALRFFVVVGGFGLAAVSLAIVALELAACFLVERVTRAGANAFSLVVLAAVALMLVLVSTGDSEVDGGDERTMYLPGKESTTILQAGGV